VFSGGGSAYCFKNLPFQPKGGSVSIDYGNATPVGANHVAELQISSTGTTGDCTGTQVEVSTDTATFTKEPFYIVLYG
jgi:hypothetical protein